MNLIDNWEGYYEYGEGYTLPQFGKRVKLFVNLQGNNDKFIGTVREETSEYSVPLEAMIHGFSEDDFISFVKTYPKRPTLKEYGSKSIIMEQGPLEIEHTGFIDLKFDSMYGTWQINSLEKDENGTFEVQSFGNWLLKKVS